MNTTLSVILFSSFCLLSSQAEEHRTLEATSRSGAKGVTVATARHSKGEWMNSALIVTEPSKPAKEFRISRAFIEKWNFADHEKSVVIRSRNVHGPSWIEKYDITSGKLLAECSGSDALKDTPEWARPFCDSAESVVEK